MFDGFFMLCIIQDNGRWIKMNRKSFEVRLGCCKTEIPFICIIGLDQTAMSAEGI
jgi:hypothetical protein